MKPVNFPELSAKIEKFMVDRDWDQFHNLKNLSMALSVEVAELVELFQWVNEAQVDSVIQDSKKKSMVEDELADIAIYLIRFLQKSDIDLEAAIARKMKKNSEKYPIELSKGNSKKYSEL